MLFSVTTVLCLRLLTHIATAFLNVSYFLLPVHTFCFTLFLLTIMKKRIVVAVLVFPAFF